MAVGLKKFIHTLNDWMLQRHNLQVNRMQYIGRCPSIFNHQTILVNTVIDNQFV